MKLATKKGTGEFPHTLLLTNAQASYSRKSFADNSSAYSKLSKTQISKVIQSGGYLGKSFWTLLNVGLWTLMKKVIKLLAKSILIPLGLTASASAAEDEMKSIISWK